MKIFCFCIFLVWSGVGGFAEEKPPLREDARKQFSAADAKLNKAYQAARRELSPEYYAELQKLQRDWLSYRDEKAKQLLWFNKRIAEDTPQQCETHPEYWNYKTSLTKDRIEFLQIYSGKAVPEGLTGKYRDFYGGHLQLTKNKGNVLFQMSVVRGVNAHTGEIGGVAKLKGNVAIYKARVPDDPEKKWCEITFTFKNEHLVEVRAKNAGYYGGMGVSFEGAYYKTCEPLIMETSLSPNQSYGVRVPVFSSFSGSDSAETEGSDNELIEMKAGRVLGSLDVGEDWRAGLNRALNYHEILPARWSDDSSLLIWEVAGKWFSDALVVVRLKKGEIQWQLNILKDAQYAILARTKEASPKQYMASKKKNEGWGIAYIEGFSIDVQVLDPIKLPLRVHVRLTDSPKGYSKLNAYMDAVISPKGGFVVQSFHLGKDKPGKSEINRWGW